MGWKLTILTHTDADGVSAAAIALRVSGGRLGEDTRLLFTEPYKLYKQLKSIASSVSKDEMVLITDIGWNLQTADKTLKYIKTILSRGARVYWIDHHRWEREEIERLRKLGVNMFIDNSTCAAGLVVKYAREVFGREADEFCKRLAKAVCAADVWIWDDPYAPRIFRIVDWKRFAAGDRWRRKLISKLLVVNTLEEFFQDEEIKRALMDYIHAELRNFEKIVRSAVVHETTICGRKVRYVIALKGRGPPARSIVARALATRFDADMVVIVHRNISFRSEVLNVRDVARALGGGGHYGAAGAKLVAPFWWRLLFLIYPRAKVRYVRGLVEKALSETGCKLFERT